MTKRHNVRPNLENDLENILEDKHKNAVATSQQLTYVLKDREKERERERENGLEDLHSALQCVFAEEIVDGKITVTLVKAKSLQISSFYGMTDLQIRDKVRSIIKAKIVSGNIMQDEE